MSMLQGFLSQLLTDYLSTYIKGIQPEQIRIGIWNGVALLENAELQLEAFDYLQLPFAIKQGIVGRLRFQVPWKKLGWEPIVIVLEDVFICASPRDDPEWNADALDARALAGKKAKLAAAELSKLSTKLSQCAYDDNSGQSFWSYLSAKIIDNIQVTLQNVHFHYVDRLTHPEVLLSFGITFTELNVSTIGVRDHTSLPGSFLAGKRNVKLVQRLVAIQKLAIFWVSDEHCICDLMDPGSFKNWSSWKNNAEAYVIKPLDVSLKLTVSRTLVLDGSTSQYNLDLDANNMDLTLSDCQLRGMLSLWHTLYVCTLRGKYGRFRPCVGQPGYNRSGNGWQRCWWNYAIKAVLVDVHKRLRRNSWSHLEWRMEMRRQYVPLYRLKLECLLWHQPVVDDVRIKLDKLEEELDLDEILSFRSIAESQLPLCNVHYTVTNKTASDCTKGSGHELQQEDGLSQKQHRWLNFLSLGILGAAGSTVSGQFAGILPDEDTHEMMRYHLADSGDDGDLHKGYCCVTATIHVDGLHIVLKSLYPDTDIISVTVWGIDGSMQMWLHYMTVSIAISSIEAVDLTASDSIFLCILGAKNKSLPVIFKKEGRLPSCVDVTSGTKPVQDKSFSGQAGSFDDTSTFMWNVKENSKDSALVIDVDSFSNCREFHMTTKAVMQSLEFVYTPSLMNCFGAVFGGWTSVKAHREPWICNAPIFKIFVRNTIVNMVWQRDGVDISFCSVLEGDYLNIEKVVWEPFLEPWNVSFCVERTFGSKGLPYTKAMITSTSQLNLNITSSLSQAISHALYMLHDSMDTTIPVDSSGRNGRGKGPVEIKNSMPYSPYWLQNDTGVAIKYWLLNSSKIKDSYSATENIASSSRVPGGSRDNVLQPGCSAPLDIENYTEELFQRASCNGCSKRLTYKKAFDRKNRMIYLQLEGTCKPSVPMSIDLVGSMAFDVVFSHSVNGWQEHKIEEEKAPQVEQQPEKKRSQERENGFSTPVVFEVSIIGYSKLVRIYSTVTLLNATPIPLEVRFDIPFGICPKVMEPIFCGQVMPLPVHLAETGQIRLRPIGSNHLWSEAQSLPSILLPTSRSSSFRSVLCYPTHHSDAPFRYCITVGETCIPVARTLYMGFQHDKNGSQVQGRNMECSCQLHNKSLGGGFVRCLEKGYVREITIQAPLVFKNCLPLPLSLVIDSGAGADIHLSAPEGDSIFVFEVSTVHDLNLILDIPGFLACTVKLARAVTVSSDFEIDSLNDEKIFSAETLVLTPDTSSGLRIYAKIEKVVNTISGARELCIFVPFWLYNFSGLDLAVTDGDVDMPPGKGQQSGVQIIDGGKSAQRKGYGLLLECAGLESILQVASVDTFHLDLPCHSSELQSEVWSDLPGYRLARCSCSSVGICNHHIASHLSSAMCRGRCLLDRKCAFSSHGGESCLGKHLVDSRKVIEVEPWKAHIYSPLKDEEASEKKMRVMAVLPQSDKSLEWHTSVWSSPFPLNPPGGMVAIVVPQPHSKGAFLLSVFSAPALGACLGKTRTITFQPRFVLGNFCKRDLYYKQQGTQTFKRLFRGEQSCVHWSNTSRALLLSIRFDDHGWEWSGGFYPDHLGDTQLKVRNYVTGGIQMVRIEVQNGSFLENGRNEIGSPDNSMGMYLIFIFDDDTGFMPYRIDNCSNERLRFYQQKCEKFESNLLPYSSCSYAWDEPWQPHQLVLEVPGEGCLGAFGLDEVNFCRHTELPATTQKPERKFLVSVHIEQPIRVLTIQEIDLHAVTVPNGNHKDGLSKQFTRFTEQKNSDVLLVDEVMLNLPSIGISVVDSSPKEIVFGCARGISAHFIQRQHKKQFHFQISLFQIDNQLRHTQYPVMVSAGSGFLSTVVDENVASERTLESLKHWMGRSFEFSGEAAFTMVVLMWRNVAGSFDCFECVNVRVAPMRVQLEEHVVISLLVFFRSSMLYASLLQSGSSLSHPSLDSSGNQGSSPRKYEFLLDSRSRQLCYVKAVRQAQVYKSWPISKALQRVGSRTQKVFVPPKRARKVYIENLVVAPIDLTISFSSSPWLSKEDPGDAAQSLLWITGASVQRGLMALVDVEGVPVHFRKLMFSHHLASWKEIKGNIARYYTRQLLHEVYKVLGSVGVFGNPMGFMRSLGNGIHDFVSAPARSFIQSPRFFARDIAQGTCSLVNNTVFAISNAATQMSRAARKGVTAFTLDHEYLAEMERRREHYFQENSILNELLEGLTGLLQSPVVGAERHGVLGILSGVAVGVVRLVARPAASILEVAGRMAHSVRSWSNPNQVHEKRIRPPRHLDKGVLLPYSLEDAVGNAVLQEAVGGHLQNQNYFICKPLAQPGRYILLTERVLLRVRKSLTTDAGESGFYFGPEWTVDLEISHEDILHIDRDGAILSILFVSRTCPKNRGPHRLASYSKPLLHQSIEMMTEVHAEELSSIVSILIDKCCKGKPQFILASRMASCST